LPNEWRTHDPLRLGNASFKTLLSIYSGLLTDQGIPRQVVDNNAKTLSERTQLVVAFEKPDQVLEVIGEKVSTIVEGFPRTAEEVQCGRNPGDVLDPYILAATQTLLFGGDFEPAMQATVAHKALMMVEGLLGHLHEDVIGMMRGNVRVPEPRGADQETISPIENPFPGSDVIQPPQFEGDLLKFHQLKSKTGSAKGGDGRRLGEQLQRLKDLYGGDIYYHALIGNTLRGHRSRAGVERAAPGVVVLVGNASFRVLTCTDVGPQLLLRLYQTAFAQAATELGYRADIMAAGIVEHFQVRAEQEGDGFLEVILNDAVGGPPEQQDSRVYVSQRRGRYRT